MRIAAGVTMSFFLAAIVSGTACSSDDSDARPSGSDAAAATDGFNGDSSPSDSGGGCTSAQESSIDAGCIAVLPAGGRVLAMEVDPPSELDYAKEVDVAHAIGVGAVAVTLPWSALEVAPPDGGAPVIDGSLFAELSAVYSSRPVALMISIPLVDMASVLAPADLAPQLTAGTLAFDDASVVARYEKLLDALFSGLGSNVAVTYLLVANEENIYLASKPAAQWTALANFYATIKAYVATKQPKVTAGMNLSFGGLLDSAQRTKLTTLYASSADVFVSYYLGDNGFGSAASTTVSADIDTMIAFAGARPLVLKEFGYATGTSGHDVSGQVAFITDLFQSWDAHAAQIPMATISRMFDGKLADCTSEAANYGQSGNSDFIAFLCTLGVRTVDDGAKPAWARLTDAAARRRF